MNEIDAKRKKLTKLEEGNQRSYSELCNAAGTNLAMDTSNTRRETLIEKLREWGIITESQWLDFEIAFHTKVEEALNEYWSQFRTAEEKAKRANLTVVKNATRLVDGRGRPLGG